MTAIDWIGAVVGAGLAAAATVLLIGVCLPRRRVFSRTVVINQSPAMVWQAISNFERVPSWWPLCVAFERIDDRDGRRAYRQSFKFGRRVNSMVIESIESKEPERQTTRIADDHSPFRGSWIYDLKPEGNGCRVSLTEHGEIPNPLFRVIFRLMMTRSMFVDSYLVSLGKKFGQNVEPHSTVNP